MNKSLSFLLVFFAMQLFAVNGQAQTVTLEDANKLFNFAEIYDTGLFSPPAETQMVNEAGSDWYLRIYSNSGVFLAVNINGTGTYSAGKVFALGGPFGAEPVLVDILENYFLFQMI